MGPLQKAFFSLTKNLCPLKAAFLQLELPGWSLAVKQEDHITELQGNSTKTVACVPKEKLNLIQFRSTIVPNESAYLFATSSLGKTKPFQS